MKILAPLVLVVMLIAAAVVSAQTPDRRETLTNESIINLTKARFKENTIITLIRTSDVKFDITTAKLVELKKRGVNEKVISEMIARANLAAAIASQGMGSLRDDEFFAKDDEAFFNGPIFKGSGPDKDPKRREDETSIFGSQSGSKSGTRSRGGFGGPNGDRQNQSEVTGSASVRIIRPQGEGSAAEPKLQRAARLDNKGVLDLIQAGFTEGTIIRKIETSQVDFDLSKKGLDELRKNRVSESIIKMMTTAMEESK
jgi:hypothetical protein